MAIKRELDQHVGDTAASIETSPRSLRDSSVATMVDGSYPYRASSVRPASVFAPTTRTVPPTPPDTSNASNTPAEGGDVEMMDGNATDESNPDAMQKLGQRSRSLIQVIQKLSAFNIDTTLPSLPKIILVGDQSAGKSSVIEALCDITMPRNEGTCTRCPFMLTTTSSVVNSSAWTCTISIMNKFAFVRSVRAGQDGEIYDYWQKQKEAASVQFAVIYRKEDLEQALRRAQLAILNPGRDCHDFSNLAVDTRQKQKTQVAFSPNVVCLEIASPNLPELSFYDLPGAINSMSDPEDQYLVDFVSTLLKSYINDEKATVLLACAANQDIETSTSIRYLTESRTSNGKARGDSVLGVLTKPDLVDDNPEKIAGIGNIMGGGVFRMDYGWFVTKQLSQKQLSQGISHEKARKAETEFFAGGPWANDLATYQTRFGTENLQNALSKILTSHILEELPGIVARVKGRLSEVDQALATFPAQDAAPTIAIIQEVDAVKTAILAQLNADAMSSFRTAYREVARDIQKGLIECQPIVDLSTPGYVKKSISIDDSSDEESPSKKAKVKSTQREYSVAPSRTPVPKSVNSSNQNSADRRRKLPAGNAAAPRAATRANFNLKDVQRDFDSAPGADLPGGTSDLVTRALILKTLCGFRSVSNKSLQTVKAVFLRMLNDTLNTALAARRATDLFKKASRIVRALFDELMAEESAIISRIITRENYRPISHSSEAIRMKRKQHSTELQARRLKHRVLEHFETLESEGQKVNGPDVEKKSRDPVWAQANLGADDYEREVKELVTPLAYYDVAAAQLCDNLCRELEFGLLHAFEERLHRRLLEDLRTGDAAYCAELLAEDPERERERVALMAEKDKLQQALEELNRLPDTHA